MSTRPAVRRLVGEDLASEQMLALMREAAGLPDAELRRILTEELAVVEVVGTGPQGAPTSVAAYVSRPDGVCWSTLPWLRGYVATESGVRSLMLLSVCRGRLSPRPTMTPSASTRRSISISALRRRTRAGRGAAATAVCGGADPERHMSGTAFRPEDVLLR